MSSFFTNAHAWCAGRVPYGRALLLAYFLYIGVRHIASASYNSLFKMLNLGIHELGHFVFAFFGEFLQIAGGTILQCLVPIISMFMFYRQRDFFAIAIAFGWLSTNLFDVATYMADARDMMLPLVSPFGGEDIVHDWNYLLSALGLLEWDTRLAFLVRVAAVVSMLICLIFGGWLIGNMVKVKEEQ